MLDVQYELRPQSYKKILLSMQTMIILYKRVRQSPRKKEHPAFLETNL